MKTENQLSKIKPADRLASVSEYYFSKKLKEVAQMNARRQGCNQPGHRQSRHASFGEYHTDALRCGPQPRRTWLPALCGYSRTAPQLCRLV